MSTIALPTFLGEKKFFISFSELKRIYQQNWFPRASLSLFTCLWKRRQTWYKSQRVKGVLWDTAILLFQRYCYHEHTTIDCCLRWEPQHSIWIRRVAYKEAASPEELLTEDCFWRGNHFLQCFGHRGIFGKVFRGNGADDRG